MQISYSIADCSLGRVLVAATDRGISAVYLGDKDESLAAALHKEYPQAEIQRSPEENSQWVRTIVRHLAGAQPQLDLPTDVAATAFQRRVWEALETETSQTRSIFRLALLTAQRKGEIVGMKKSTED